jgi:hypothetical protein
VYLRKGDIMLSWIDTVLLAAVILLLLLAIISLYREARRSSCHKTAGSILIFIFLLTGIIASALDRCSGFVR